MTARQARLLPERRTEAPVEPDSNATTQNTSGRHQRESGTQACPSEAQKGSQGNCPYMSVMSLLDRTLANGLGESGHGRQGYRY